MHGPFGETTPVSRDRKSSAVDILRRQIMRDIEDLRLWRPRLDHALELADVSVRGAEVGEQGHERPCGRHDVFYTFRVFHRPARHNAIMPIPRPAAVVAITVQMPVVPQREAHCASGIRNALIEVDVIIGATV